MLERLALLQLIEYPPWNRKLQKVNWTFSVVQNTRIELNTFYEHKTRNTCIHRYILEPFIHNITNYNFISGTSIYKYSRIKVQEAIDNINGVYSLEENVKLLGPCFWKSQEVHEALVSL